MRFPVGPDRATTSMIRRVAIRHCSVAFILRQLRPEELYRSLLVASYAKLTPELAAKHRPPRDRWLRQFVQALGTTRATKRPPLTARSHRP